MQPASDTQHQTPAAAHVYAWRAQAKLPPPIMACVRYVDMDSSMQISPPLAVVVADTNGACWRHQAARMLQKRQRAHTAQRPPASSPAPPAPASVPRPPACAPTHADFRARPRLLLASAAGKVLMSACMGPDTADTCLLAHVSKLHGRRGGIECRSQQCMQYRRYLDEAQRDGVVAAPHVRQRLGVVQPLQRRALQAHVARTEVGFRG